MPNICPCCENPAPYYMYCSVYCYQSALDEYKAEQIPAKFPHVLKKK